MKGNLSIFVCFGCEKAKLCFSEVIDHAERAKWKWNHKLHKNDKWDERARSFYDGAINFTFGASLQHEHLNVKLIKECELINFPLLTWHSLLELSPSLLRFKRYSSQDRNYWCKKDVFQWFCVVGCCCCVEKHSFTLL